MALVGVLGVLSSLTLLLGLMRRKSCAVSSRSVGWRERRFEVLLPWPIDDDNEEEDDNDDADDCKDPLTLAKVPRLHALSPFGTAARNDGAVDVVVGFIDPFVCSFATITFVRIFQEKEKEETYSRTHPTPTHFTKSDRPVRTFSIVRTPPSL